MVTGEEPISRWLGISPTKFLKKNTWGNSSWLYSPLAIPMQIQDCKPHNNSPIREYNFRHLESIMGLSENSVPLIQW